METLDSTQDLLVAVFTRLSKYEASGQPPLSTSSRDDFRARVVFTLSYDLPPAYLDILSQSDGLDWNGHVLYASETRMHADDSLAIQGLLEANMQLRLVYTPDKNFVYFAESGMDAYRHDLLKNTFEIADRTSATVFETFETADALFQRLLQGMLNLVPSDEDDSSDF